MDQRTRTILGIALVALGFVSLVMYELVTTNRSVWLVMGMTFVIVGVLTWQWDHFMRRSP